MGSLRRHIASPSRPPRVLAAALAFALALALATREARPVRAESPAPGSTTGHSRWMGAYWGLELKTGLSIRTTDGELDLEPAVGLGARIATLMSLVDLELSALVTPLDERYTRTAIGLDLRLHPLFVRMLHADFGSRVLAGLHLAVGGGVDLLSAPPPPALGGDASASTKAAFAFSFGLGADIPLTNPARNDPSLWLGIGWRMRFVGFESAPPGLRDMDEHLVVLQLGLRFHDIGFARIPKPPELDDRDR